MRKEHGYISIRNYELEEGTSDNLTINSEYIIEHSSINIKQLYHKFQIRSRYSFETKSDYKEYYVETIRKYIENKIIFKLNKIQ